MMPLLLNLTWLIPAFSILPLCLVGHRPRALRVISLASAGTVLALVVALLAAYLRLGPDPEFSDPAGLQLAFVSRFAWFRGLGVEFFTGVDAVSLLMMAMAAVVAVGGVLASWRIEERAREFHVLLAVLLAGTFGCFITVDLIAFFLFNEITLIPTYLLIGIFGSGRKEAAAMKLNLMLFGGSALIVAGLCGLGVVGGSFDLAALGRNEAIRADTAFQWWAFPCLFGGFAILGSLFPFHTWSPAGHSAAPTAISMFLAGVHMKLGGYGCLKVAMYLLPEGARTWMPVFLALAAVSVLYGAFIAIRHRDLKFLNAYASVSHVGMVTFAFAALTATGLRGGVLQMLSHGFVTALMFALIGAIYARTHTRDVDQMGGLYRRMPFLAGAFAVAGFAVLGVPGTSSFVAEFTILVAGFAGAGADPLRAACAIACAAAVVVTAVYVLRAVNRTVAGPLPENAPVYADASRAERGLVVLLLVGILGLGLAPGWIAGLLDQSLAPIVGNLSR